MESYLNEKVEVCSVKCEIFRRWQHKIGVVFSRLHGLLFLVNKQSFEIRLTENLDWDLWLSLENSNKVIQNFIPEI